MQSQHVDAAVVTRAPRSAPREGFWEGRLGYAHSAVLATVFFVFGCALHAVVGYSLPVHLSPFGWLIAGMVVASALAGRVWRKHRVAVWLFGIPTAVASTVSVVVMGIFGGIVPQSFVQQRLGVESVWASWPFLMLVSLMLVNLVGSVGKRVWPLSYVNIVYLMSHLGLAVAIIGGALGGALMERGLLVLFPGQQVSVADVRTGGHFDLPFWVSLREFQLESFAPVLAVAQLDPKAEEGFRLTPGEDFVAAGSEASIAGVSYRVDEYLPLAVRTGSGWQAAPWKSAAPAARVTAKLSDGKTVSGWVSCGSTDAPSEHLELADGVALLMPDPRPKRFASEVEIKGVGNRTIEVNKPVTVQGYTLYQVSYDDKAGAASAYSVVEAVHDRALPVVYSGIGLMLFGACLHLWNGVGRGAK